MKIHVMSDLHLEFLSPFHIRDFFLDLADFKQKNESDVVVLPGDILSLKKKNYLEILNRFCSMYKDVVYVFGNHEYYGISVKEGDLFCAEIKSSFPNIHLLNNETKTVEQNVFCGGTMWFPNKNATPDAKSRMSDFSVIKDVEPYIYLKHAEFLLTCLNTTKRIVVTHHLPVEECVSARFVGSDLNQFFHADLGRFLNEGNLPTVWIHGHTHDPVDFVYSCGTSSMRVYANPKGYPREGVNSRFWERVAIDV